MDCSHASASVCTLIKGISGNRQRESRQGEALGKELFLSLEQPATHSEVEEMQGATKAAREALIAGIQGFITTLSPSYSVIHILPYKTANTTSLLSLAGSGGRLISYFVFNFDIMPATSTKFMK